MLARPGFHHKRSSLESFLDFKAGILGAGQIVYTDPVGNLKTEPAFTYDDVANNLNIENVNINSNAGLLRFGIAQDVILARDAAGILAQKNGINQQKFRVYANATEFVEVSRDPANSYISHPTGVPASGLQLRAWGNLITWDGGTFYPGADNAYNFGTSTSRWLAGYFGESVNSIRFDTPNGINHILGSGPRDVLRIVHEPIVGNGIDIASTDTSGIISFEPLSISGSEIGFNTNALRRITLDSNGHLLWNSDGALDIGASDTNRPRDIYVANSIRIGPNLLTDHRLQVVGNNGGMLYAQAALSSSGGYTTNWLRSLKNTVTCYIGNDDLVTGYTATEYSGALRFNGLETAWGDIAYFPNADNGHFKFQRSSTDILTGLANGDVGIGIGYFTTSIKTPIINNGPSTLLANGGVDGSVINAPLKFPNNRILAWRDAAGGDTNCGFIWYDTSNQLNFGTSNNSQWRIKSTAHLIPTANGVYDLGEASNTVRTGYFGTRIFVPELSTGAASNLLLSTSGGGQLEVSHKASAVNRIMARGSVTGLGPILSSYGSDTNIDLNIISQGSGSISLKTDVDVSEPTQFRVTHTASSNRFITVTGSNGGNPTLGTNAGDLVINSNVLGLGFLTLSGSLAVNGNTQLGDSAVDTANTKGTHTSGMGTGSGVMTLQGKANVNTTAVGNVETGEDDLITYALPANSLNTAGKGVRVTVWGTTLNNANAKTLKIYFGTTACLTDGLPISIAHVWKIVLLVFSTGVDTQDFHAHFNNNVNVSRMTVGTSAQDDGAAITVKCTGTGVVNNDIVQEGMLVEFFN